MDQKIRLILASASPRRRQLLKKLGLPFRVMPSHVPEDSKEKNPVRLVKELALRKAMQVARKIGPLTLPSPRGEGLRVRGPVVLGADTVVVLDDWIVSKPSNEKHALKMLARLAGSTHHVYTGVALVDAETKKSVVSYAKSSVKMKALEPEQV